MSLTGPSQGPGIYNPVNTVDRSIRVHHVIPTDEEIYLTELRKKSMSQMEFYAALDVSF